MWCADDRSTASPVLIIHCSELSWDIIPSRFGRSLVCSFLFFSFRQDAQSSQITFFSLSFNFWDAQKKGHPSFTAILQWGRLGLWGVLCPPITETICISHCNYTPRAWGHVVTDVTFLEYTIQTQYNYGPSISLPISSLIIYETEFTFMFGHFECH